MHEVTATKNKDPHHISIGIWKKINWIYCLFVLIKKGDYSHSCGLGVQ